MSSSSNPTPTTAEMKPVDYTKLIPFATAGLIFLGVSRLMFYYGLFGVNIIPFLEFSEIVTSFLDEVIIVVTLLAILLAFLGLPINERVKDEITVVKKNGIEITKHKETGELFIYKINKPFMFKAIIILLLCAIVLIPMFYRDLNLLLVSTIITVIGFWSVSSLYNRYKKNPSKLFNESYLIAVVLIMSETLVIDITYFKYRLATNGKRTVQTKIVFTNDTFAKDTNHIFISDSSSLCIGKTNSFIFVRYMNENRTSIYPMSSVKQIDIKNNAK